jgi:hypothetical protein
MFEMSQTDCLGDCYHGNNRVIVVRVLNLTCYELAKILTLLSRTVTDSWVRG